MKKTKEECLLMNGIMSYDLGNNEARIMKAMDDFAEDAVNNCVAPPVSVSLPLTETRLCELHDIAKRYCYTTQDNSPTISRKGVELLILEISNGNER